MIRALIADDEPLARRTVRGLLEGYADVDVVGESRNGAETLGAIRRLAPDLVFLDVQMPELDGFGVLASLEAEVVPSVVFVTAYDDFAVRAFEEAALDYLVKPFTDERFHRTMARVRRQVSSGDGADLTRTVMALVERAAARTPSRDSYLMRLLVSSGNRSTSVRMADVHWIEADDYYARLHTRDGSSLVRQSLTALESQLDPAGFVRVHRGAIVNIDQVRELVRDDQGRIDIVLRDGSRIGVSERRRESVLTRLGGTG
ncbi:MAG TPA: LytTR family transcriptional regulator DNA-binding domain-containing protein [Gemmatimonadaceae bacterium]|nr:LytTR family transcriptional regulator DNA-binding domain-containing protein [Gemmatimonadaceae bacterium]